MKRWYFLFLFFTPLYAADNPSPADSVNFVVKDLSSGMWSFPSANEIPDNAATYIQNFFTDIQGMCVERNGTVRKESTVLGSGVKSVSGLWAFLDVNGNEWLIAFSSNTFYKEQAGAGSFTVFGPTITTTNQVYATVNLGKIWFVDGVDTLWWFDGTSTGSVAAAPIGKYIASWRNRIAIGNITGSQSTVQFSKDGDGLTWALGPGDSDPFSIQVGGANDGFGINCLYGMYQDTLMIGRKFDLWGMYGFTQADEQTRRLTSEIGCIQNGTMKESDGDLIWLSARGLEKLNGSGLQLISDPIRDITDALVKNTSNRFSWVQTSALDFGGGGFDNSFYLDTQTVSGNLQLTFPDLFTTYRDGSNNSKIVWNNFGVRDSTNIISSGGNLIISAKSNNSEQVMRSQSQFNNYKGGTTYYFNVPSENININGNTTFIVGLSSEIQPSGTVEQQRDYFYLTYTSTQTNKIFLKRIDMATNLVPDLVNGCGLFGTPCQNTGDSSVPLQLLLYIDTSTYKVTQNGVVIKSGTHTFPNVPPYMYVEFYNNLNNGGGFTDTINLNTFGVAPETDTYRSQVNNAPNILAWDIFVANYSNATNGSQSFFLRSSTNPITVNSSTPTWTSITSGAVPSASTGTYFQVRDDFVVTNATDTPILYDFTQNWTELKTPPNVAYTWDRRYWLAYTTNNFSGATLDTVLVYQRNKTFTVLKGINAASFARYLDRLYYGDSTGTTGLVYQYDIGTNDDGNNITSILTTKSYDVGYPYRDKDLRRMYTGFLGSSNFTGSYSLTYDVDRSGNAYALGSVNMNDYNGLQEAKFPFPLNSSPTQGREVQYTLTKSGTGDRLKLYELRTMFSLKEPQ